MPVTYDRYAKLFHWALVLMVAAQFVSAWIMPEELRSPDALVNFHMSFGILILAFMFLRFLWRMFVGAPAPHAAMPKWQAWASVLTHYALYALLVAMPVLGWLWASALGWQVTLFGLVTLPQLTAAQPGLANFIGELHSFVGGAIIALLALHVAAAFYHLLILKDEVMQRMLP